MSIDNIQRQLSDYQVTPVLGPIFVSPIKLLVSTVQVANGMAMEILFGTLATIAESFDCMSAAQDYDDLCYQAVDIRKKGIKHLLSAGYNFFTMAQHGHELEIYLGLRYRAAKI